MLSVSKSKPMEVLLVEDGLTDASLTIFALRRSGIHHRLTLVRCVDEAIRFLRCEGVFARAPKPDLVLLDVTLPDGSGIDVLNAIEDLPFELTTVMLTASGDEETRDQCERLRVSDYIVKPVHEDKFLRVVREHKKSMLLRTSAKAASETIAAS